MLLVDSDQDLVDPEFELRIHLSGKPFIEFVMEMRRNKTAGTIGALYKVEEEPPKIRKLEKSSQRIK